MSWMPPPAWVASRCRPRPRWPSLRSKNSSGAPTGDRTCQTRRSRPLVHSKALPIEALWVVPTNKEASSRFLQIWRQGCQVWSEGAEARPRGPSSDYTLCTMEVRYLIPPLNVYYYHTLSPWNIPFSAWSVFVQFVPKSKKESPLTQSIVIFFLQILEFSELFWTFFSYCMTNNRACMLVLCGATSNHSISNHWNFFMSLH